jgi:hypothetical protein
MKTITKKYKVYNFNELNEAAKEKAIEQFQDINVNYEWYEDDCIYNEIANDYGLEINMDEINFDLDRENYAAFETYTHGSKKNYVKGIYIDDYQKFFKKAGLNTKLKRVKEAIGNIWIDHNHFAGGEIRNYVNSDYTELTEADLEDLETCLEKFTDKILDVLKQQYEYLTSSEAIIETIETNEYQFLEDGENFNE